MTGPTDLKQGAGRFSPPNLREVAPRSPPQLAPSAYQGYKRATVCMRTAKCGDSELSEVLAKSMNTIGRSNLVGLVVEAKDPPDTPRNSGTHNLHEVLSRPAS